MYISWDSIPALVEVSDEVYLLLLRPKSNLGWCNLGGNQGQGRGQREDWSEDETWNEIKSLSRSLYCKTICTVTQKTVPMF